MSEKKKANEQPELNAEVAEKTSRIKDFLKEKKKTLITVTVTAASTAAAVLWLKRERTEDEDYYDDEFENEDD